MFARPMLRGPIGLNCRAMLPAMRQLPLLLLRASFMFLQRAWIACRTGTYQAIQEHGAYGRRCRAVALQTPQWRRRLSKTDFIFSARELTTVRSICVTRTEPKYATRAAGM